MRSAEPCRHRKKERAPILEFRLSRARRRDPGRSYLSYALKVGKSIGESGRKELDPRAEDVMADILRKADANIDKKRTRRSR